MSIGKKLIVCVAVGLSGLLFTGVAQAVMSARQVVKALAAAVNAGDEAGAAALLADNIQWSGCGPSFGGCTGKAQVVAEEIRYDIATASHVTLTKIRGNTTSAVGRFAYSNNDTMKAGVSRIVGDFEAETDESGKLVSFSVTADRDDPETLKFMSAGSPTHLPATGDGSLAARDAARSLHHRELAGATILMLSSLAFVTVRRRRTA